MKSTQRIIDRDIEFYQSMIDYHHQQVFRATSGEEAKPNALHNAAKAIVDAMENYRLVIDGERGLRVGDTVRVKEDKRELRGTVMAFGYMHGEKVAHVGEGDYCVTIAITHIERIS